MWVLFASVPLNLYWTVKMAKEPLQALKTSYLKKSLIYMFVSSAFFAASVSRYHGFTKELSTRYLTNMSNQDL